MKLRQATSYWDMVAAFALHGALNDNRFLRQVLGTRCCSFLARCNRS